MVEVLPINSVIRVPPQALVEHQLRSGWSKDNVIADSGEKLDELARRANPAARCDAVDGRPVHTVEGVSAGAVGEGRYG